MGHTGFQLDGNFEIGQLGRVNPIKEAVKQHPTQHRSKSSRAGCSAAQLRKGSKMNGQVLPSFPSTSHQGSRNELSSIPTAANVQKKVETRQEVKNGENFDSSRPWRERERGLALRK
ncbi:HIG1 domain-containing protein [Psidium guajava]|nr:HIG1 domain-containing protein [Psidium guajava]